MLGLASSTQAGPRPPKRHIEALYANPTDRWRSFGGNKSAERRDVAVPNPPDINPNTMPGPMIRRVIENPVSSSAKTGKPAHSAEPMIRG
mmetsp:Transcript_11791/g.29071  ORF Transcript_11791/g.29071 Transcript_11791/m.29071 type:complete len:90 (+) Transcript_11791:316-585(+)